MNQDERPKHEVRGFDPAKLVERGFSLGGADLLQGGRLKEIVGRVLAFFIVFARTANDGRLFTGAAVVLPPVEATEFTSDIVHAALAKAVEDLRGVPMDADESAALGRVVRVLHAPSLEVSDVVRIVDQQGQNSLIVVAEASRFRDNAVELRHALGATAARLPEDRWTPHVTSLLRQVATAVEGTKRHALLHVDEPGAKKVSNQEQLQSVPNTSVFVMELEGDPDEVIAARAADWTSLAVQGRLSEVAAELEQTDLSEARKIHLLTHLSVRTGRKRETLELLRKLQPHLEELAPMASIQAAQFALGFDDADLADEMLPKSPDGVTDPLWLEAGLEAAMTLEDNERIAAFDARLGLLVPGSADLRENRDRRLLLNCQEAGAGRGQPFTPEGFTEHHLELQRRLSEFEPDYEAAVEAAQTWGQEWLELAVVCCAIHARSAERFVEAASAASAVTASKVYGRQAAQVLLYSVRSMMLRELVPKDERDQYRPLFEAAFEYLARFPADANVRTYLISLLSVDSCGDQGIPLVAFTMLDLVERGVATPPPEAAPAFAEADLHDDDVKNSIAKALRWLGEKGGVEPGVSVIPRELIVASPDAVLLGAAKLVELAGARQGEDVDLGFMEQLVLVACVVSPHATRERDADIRLLRLLAGNLSAAGQYQRARDLAEQILLLGQASPLRQRLAWSAYADIYHRGRNYVVALVGVACALAIEVAVPKADVWQEVYTIHRILRDLNLFDLARQFMPAMRTLIAELGYNAETDPRIVSADLALQLMETRGRPLAELQELLAKIAAAVEGALGKRNLLFPLAILLGQAAAKVQAAGGEVPQATSDILATALRDVGKRVASTIETISAEKPTAEGVLAMFNEVQRAAYAGDVARDYLPVGVAARRLVGAAGQDLEATTASVFAIELLADHAVKLLSDAPKMTVEWPTQYAFELNDAGWDVVFMSIDDEGHLSVIHVTGKTTVVIEQPRHEKNFRRRFDAWLARFPREYGHVDPRDGNDIFYHSMEELDVRLPQTKRMLIVAEPALQQLTANLVVIQPDDGGFGFFAGRDGCIGAVPSLTWLAAARAAPRSEKKAYKAWISAQLEPQPEAGEEAGDEPRRVQTLDVVLQRLSGSFEQFGFDVDVSRRLPQEMGDAGLAVVTAHGDVSSDGRFLRRISDDAKLVEAPSALAACMKGVEVVVLFVCSGGRIDKNPWDNSTTSLAKQLLNGGTRAVIASPWPLNVLVTYVWLEPFLKAWEQGATVLDATKIANEAVHKHYGEAPQYTMAMRVYGDALLTRE